MGCASNRNQHGFTLVEISIVMIIIGLLIGGTFGGMKLIENMQVNRTVQDLKAIESAALTFKDTYGRLPGDIANPATRLPNCTVAPCATGGNGNRRIDPTGAVGNAIIATEEKFTFWHHLQAADLLSMGYKNTTNMEFGEGQPDAPIGGGYRISEQTGAYHNCGNVWTGGMIYVTDKPTSAFGPQGQINCRNGESIDLKMDDGQAANGKFTGGYGCEATIACTSAWNVGTTGDFMYDAKF